MKTFTVHLSGSTVVFVLLITRRPTVLVEECPGGSIASNLHCAQLKPCPAGIELRRPDERNVYAKGPMDGRTVDTDEHAVRDAGPGRVKGPAIEALLVGR